MNCPNRNHFCLVCALFTPASHSRPLTNQLIRGYQKYFVKIFDPNLWYQPSVVCEYCYRGLLAVAKGEKRNMKYVTPALWMSLATHVEEQCYFCQNFKKSFGINYTTREKIEYFKAPSVVLPHLRSTEHPKSQYELFEEEEMEQQHQQEEQGEQQEEQQALQSFDLPSEFGYSEPEPSSSEAQTTEYTPHYKEMPSIKPHMITQKEFDDLVRDTKLSKDFAELWGSRLKQWNLVDPDFKVTAARKRTKTTEIDKFFSFNESKNIAYCNDIYGIFEYFQHQYNPNDWRLFIDGSVNSLKAVLLHNGNEYPSVPIAYGTGVKETYDVLKEIIDLINYEEHGWSVCSDLKVVGILTGLMKGYPKHSCFLCLWEGRKTEKHYTKYKWPTRISYQFGRESIENKPLVPVSKIILPPLHIKLGLVCSFVKAMDKNTAAFKHLKTIFPKLTQGIRPIYILSLIFKCLPFVKMNLYNFLIFNKNSTFPGKIDKGCFNGPQIRQLIADKSFVQMLGAKEKRAFIAIIEVIKHFLGNKRAENYKAIIAELLEAFRIMKVNMSLKIHFLYDHLDYFPDNLGDFSDEHGERFHQELALIEQRYKGKDYRHMMAEYCWSICRSTSQEEHARQSKRSFFVTKE